jgi:iron complex outermembrane receptor protein
MSGESIESGRTQRERSLERWVLGVVATLCGGAFACASMGVARADSAASSPTGGQLASSQISQSEGLQEVVVTAERKEERLLDAPVPVTVLQPQILAANGTTQLQDFFASVPGLDFAGGSGNPSGGRQYITIRGLSTSQTGTPSVATLVDDVPISGSTANSASFGANQPDLDPSDLNRIEVLKGPQGSLYGGDSLGGLINYITKDPTTTGFEGYAQALGQGVTDGGGLGYALRAGANIPVSEQLAVRVSAFGRRDPGYVGNITTGQTDVNSKDAYGGHVSALWSPSDSLSIKLGALYQHTRENGAPGIDTNSSFQPVVGDLKQTGIPGTGWTVSDFQLYTANIDADLGGIKFRSNTGYNEYKLQTVTDLTSYFGTAGTAPGFCAYNSYTACIYPGAYGSPYPSTERLTNVSEEIRFSSSVGRWLDWIAGAFYMHEDTPIHNDVTAANAQTGVIVGAPLTDENFTPNTFQEKAVFGDLTLHFTDKFDLQIGGRKSWDSQTFGETATGPDSIIQAFFGTNSPFIQPEVRANGSPFTYLVTPEYKLSSNLMVYARIATGYQIGGTNVVVAFVPNEPGQFAPSKTTNYEIGVKGSLFDNRLSYQLSGYYIDWSQIQIGVSVPYGGFTVNGGGARSDGVEFSAQARPTDGTRISTAISYNDAVLTRSLSQAGASFSNSSTSYGPSGSVLPYSIPVTAYVDAEQDVLRFGDATAYVGGTVTYIDKRYGEFTGSAASPRDLFPAFTTGNLRAGVRYHAWITNLFIDNVANVRGIVGGGYDGRINNPGGYYAQVTRPRTVGLSVSRSF